MPCLIFSQTSLAWLISHEFIILFCLNCPGVKASKKLESSPDFSFEKQPLLTKSEEAELTEFP